MRNGRAGWRKSDPFPSPLQPIRSSSAAQPAAPGRKSRSDAATDPNLFAVARTSKVEAGGGDGLLPAQGAISQCDHEHRSGVSHTGWLETVGVGFRNGHNPPRCRASGISEPYGLIASRRSNGFKCAGWARGLRAEAGTKRAQLLLLAQQSVPLSVDLMIDAAARLIVRIRPNHTGA
jgi:hypothetical protein